MTTEELEIKLKEIKSRYYNFRPVFNAHYYSIKHIACIDILKEEITKLIEDKDIWYIGCIYPFILSHVDINRDSIRPIHIELVSKKHQLEFLPERIMYDNTVINIHTNKLNLYL